MNQGIRHPRAFTPRSSAALAVGLALVLAALACLAVSTTRGALLTATLLWIGLTAVMAYRVFVTGRIGRWRSTFFIIMAWGFIVQFKAGLIGLTGRAFVTPDVQEVPYCHIATASSFLNHLYQQYLAFMSGAWSQWSPLTWGALWLVVTLALGQAWCAWGCMYGGLDSGFARVRRRPLIPWIRLPAGVRDLPAAILLAMLLLSLVMLRPVFCLCVCPLKLGTGFLDPNTTTRALQLASFATIGMVTIIALPWLTKKRVFCGLICPFGAWQAFVGRINPYRVVIDPARCTQCQLCLRACPTFAIEREGLARHQVLPYCNRCGECMDVCRSGAIDYAVAGQQRLGIPASWGRPLFLLSAWLIGGTVSLLFVPEALVRIWSAIVP